MSNDNILLSYSYNFKKQSCGYNIALMCHGSYDAF